MNNMNNQHANQQINQHDDAFESGLSRGLSMLGDHAPAGPSPQQVLGALAKRNARQHRRSLAMAAGFALLAGAGVMLLTMNSQGVTSNDRIAIAYRDSALNHFAAASSSVRDTPPKMSPASPVFVATGDTLKSFNAALSIAEPAQSHSLIAPISADASAMDWNLTLSLTLASAQPDEAMPVIQFNSPW